MMEDLLRQLCSAHGVPGQEHEVADIVAEVAASALFDTRRDALGNVTLSKEGSRPGPSVMLCAHMDEVGAMVRYVDENGFLYIDPLGSIDTYRLLGQRVLVGTGASGIVERKESSDDKKKPTFNDLYVDIGASSREDVEREGIRIGTAITRVSPFAQVIGSRFMSKAFDNRSGLCVMLETCRRLDEFPGTVHAVATGQEEVGTRGAYAAAYSVDPDLCIALDVTFAYDTPQKKDKKDANVTLGGGPALTLKDDGMILSAPLRTLVEETARELDIPLQYDISKGKTDAAPVYQSNGGVPTIALLIPLRYMHTGNEIIDMRDLEWAVELISALIKKADRIQLP
jgi:endoglucanase